MSRAITGLPQWLFDNTAGLQALEVENSPDNGVALERLKRNLRKVIEEDLTPTQRCYLQTYYLTGWSMEAVASEYGVNKSTVSRTLKRARARINKALKYSF